MRTLIFLFSCAALFILPLATASFEDDADPFVSLLSLDEPLQVPAAEGALPDGMAPNPVTTDDGREVGQQEDAVVHLLTIENSSRMGARTQVAEHAAAGPAQAERLARASLLETVLRAAGGMPVVAISVGLAAGLIALASLFVVRRMRHSSPDLPTHAELKVERPDDVARKIDRLQQQRRASLAATDKEAEPPASIQSTSASSAPDAAVSSKPSKADVHSLFSRLEVGGVIPREQSVLLANLRAELAGTPGHEAGAAALERWEALTKKYGGNVDSGIHKYVFTILMQKESSDAEISALLARVEAPKASSPVEAAPVREPSPSMLQAGAAPGPPQRPARKPSLSMLGGGPMRKPSLSMLSPGGPVTPPSRSHLLSTPPPGAGPSTPMAAARPSRKPSLSMAPNRPSGTLLDKP